MTNSKLAGRIDLFNLYSIKDVQRATGISAVTQRSSRVVEEIVPGDLPADVEING